MYNTLGTTARFCKDQVFLYLIEIRDTREFGNVENPDNNVINEAAREDNEAVIYFKSNNNIEEENDNAD